MEHDARRQAREVTKDAVLDAAERMAGVEGVSSLSLKRLAEEAGVSTMVVYSHFGDRFGLEEALLRRAFASLVAAIVDLGPPTSSTESCAQAIREWAHLKPSRFSLVFLTGHSLAKELRETGNQLISDVGRLVEKQLGWAGSADASQGLTYLAALFGFVTLELRGQLIGDSANAFADLSQSLAQLSTSHA